MEPIRVAQIMGKMLYGGTESVVMNYYRHIDRTKVQFDFIADSDSVMPIPRKDEIESLGGRIFIVPPYQKLHEYIPALVKLFKDQNYQIVHAHLNTINVFPMYAAKKAGVPVRISHSHSTAGKGEIKKNIFKYMLRPFAKTYPTHYAACSRLAGEWLFGKKAMEQGKVTIFNNAIELDKFRFDEQVRKEVREELGIDENKFVIGHVGRFCYQKNQDFLIDVFKEVYKQNPNAMLLMVGEGEDLERIKERVKNLGGVQILGNRNDVARLYQAIDVFVFPSRYEGLGLAAVEAQISGLKVVASSMVPSEVKINDNVDFIDLNKDLGEWVTAVIKENMRCDNRCSSEDYDIIQQALKLQNYYRGVFDEHKQRNPRKYIVLRKSQ